MGMTLNGVMADDSTRTAQLVQKALLIVLAVAACLILVVRRHSGATLLVVPFLVVLIPAVYVLLQRMAARARQREVEERMVMQTRAYLRDWASHCAENAVAAVERPAGGSSGDRLLPALVSKSRTLSSRGFRNFEGSPSHPRIGRLAVCGPVPHLHEKRSLTTAMPPLVRIPLNELVQQAAG